MASGSDDGIDALRESANRASDRALYPYLNAHIFGPYEGDCHTYLTTLKSKLEEAGFENAKICSDRDGQPPEGIDPKKETAFWLEESEEFIDNADVGIFVFMDYIFERDDLPDEHREGESEVADPRDIHTSVSYEITYWLENKDKDRVLMIFEEGIESELGSLIVGITESKDVEYRTVSNECVDEAAKEARSVCSNWAMGEVRDELQERHRSSGE